MPAAVVVGAIADALSRQCGVCGAEIEDDESGYHLMAAFDDDLAGRVYRPVRHSEGATGAPQQLGMRPAQSSLPPHQQAQQPEQIISPDVVQSSEDQQLQGDFVFDEIEGKFVPRDSSPGEIADISMEADTSPDERAGTVLDALERSLFDDGDAENPLNLDHIGGDGIEDFDHFRDPPMEDPAL